MGLASERRDFPDIQQHLFVRVVVTHLDQRPGGTDNDTQFLMKFAGQGGFDGLIGLDLATGEFPQAALVLGVGPSGDQDFTGGIANDRRRHMDSFHRAVSSRPACCHALNAGH
ncbi:hypothetical protein D3C78_1691400 [compost metagenome]